MIDPPRKPQWLCSIEGEKHQRTSKAKTAQLAAEEFARAEFVSYSADHGGWMVVVECCYSGEERKFFTQRKTVVTYFAVECQARESEN